MPHYEPTNSGTVIRMSRQIWRRSVGEISRPACIGTVVTRPSACRNCLWDPHWRTSTNPSRSRRAITSRGLRTGTDPTARGGLSDEDGLRPDELRLEGRLAVLHEHADYLAKVGVQFIEAVPLAVCTRESGYVPDEDAGLRIAFDHGGVSAHRY